MTTSKRAGLPSYCGFVIALLFFAFISIWVVRPASAAESDDLGRWLQDYGAIATVWVLEHRCHQLTPDEYRELRVHIGQITRRFSRSGAGATVSGIQRAAQAVADRKDCASDRGLIEQVLPAARKLNGEVTGSSYIPGVSNIMFNLLMLGDYAPGIGLEERCRFLPEDARRRLIDMFENSLNWFEAHPINAAQQRKIQSARIQVRDSDKPICDGASEQFVLQTALQIQAVAFDFDILGR